MSVQNYAWPSFKRLYVGVSGSGKTTLFWRHFCEERARVKFLFDHKAMEFCLRYGAKPCWTVEDMHLAIGAGRVVAFVPSKMFPGRPDLGFEFFCDWLFAIAEKFSGRKLVGADELQRLVDNYSRPEALLKLCDIGRTFQLDCMFIASASNAIHNLVRNQLTEVFAFRHGDRNGCIWESEKGFNVEQLLRLKRFQYVWRNLDTGDTHGPRI